MFAYLYAGIAGAALLRVKADYIIFYNERSCGTDRDAFPAVNAHVNGFGVMAIAAIEVAALKEEHRAVAGSVHAAVVNNAVYRCACHNERTFRSRTWLLRTSPNPQTTLSC